MSYLNDTPDPFGLRESLSFGYMKENIKYLQIQPLIPKDFRKELRFQEEVKKYRIPLAYERIKTA